MNIHGDFVVFVLDEQLYAVRLAVVQRVVRAVEITRLPDGPPIAIGIINLQGQVVTVIDVRRRFRLPERELRLTDQFLVTRVPRRGTGAAEDRLLALVVDGVTGVVTIAERSVIESEMILPGLGYLEGIAKTERGIVLIHDLGTFLSLEEETSLASSLGGVHP